MKVLHTSDWHLGQIFYQHDRTEEHKAVLKQISRICQEEKIDLLLVSGDIFHNSNPSAKSQKLYIDALIDMHTACPSMQIVIIAGNHDSGALLEISAPLWSLANVHVVGNISRRDLSALSLVASEEERNKALFDKHIIKILDRDASALAYVVAVPHCYSNNYPDLPFEQDPISSSNGVQGDSTNQDGNKSQGQVANKIDSKESRFFKSILRYCHSLNTEKLPVILMAHLTIAGTTYSGKKLEQIGGIDSVNLEAFGNQFDYLALGHIHKAQTLSGKSSPIARYSGSPLPISFDEDFRHSVSLVEFTDNKVGEAASKQRTIEIKEIPLETTMEVVTFPPQAQPLDKVLEAVKRLPDNKKAYLRLNVLSSEYLSPDVPSQVCEMLKNTEFSYCLIQRDSIENVGIGKDQTDKKKSLSVEELQMISPLDIAKQYYKDKFSLDLEPDVIKLLTKTIQQLHTDNSREEYIG